MDSNTVVRRKRNERRIHWSKFAAVTERPLLKKGQSEFQWAIAILNW